MSAMQNKEGIVMKLEMTQKDKNLLIMLSIFVIVVCIGYWGICLLYTSDAADEL